MSSYSSEVPQAEPEARGPTLGALLRAALRVLGVPIALVMAGCEPLVRMLFWTLCALGILATVVIEGSGAAPRFPFAVALAVFAGCGIIPLLYRAVLRTISSR